ncbi:unnamed protein product, partial [marine sediment metagenome]
MRKEDLFVLFLLIVILVMVYIFTGFSGDYGKPTGYVIVGVGGVCNDSNTDDGDGCSVENLVEAGWECNDSVVPNECSQVVSPVCGNGILEGDEVCDDGNITNGDGCSDSCLIESGWICDENEPSVCIEPICGNGILEGDEVCDDGGNNGNYSYCKIDCSGLGAYCGDDTTDTTEGELCDDGNNVTETACDYGQETCTFCNVDCTAELSLIGPYCGDGTCDSGDEDCSSCSDDCGVCKENGDDKKEPSCSNDLTLCDESNCADVGGGYWYNEKCNEEAECIPKTSCGSSCGDISDGCGGTLDCACDSGYSCVSGICEELPPTVKFELLDVRKIRKNNV